MSETENSRGLFLSLEGGEGASKSTQIKLLTERFEKLGYKVVTSHEPGGTPIGLSIRELIKYHPDATKMCRLTETLLFAAAQRQSVEELILPALAAGCIVISDRYVDSNTAYQGHARQNDMTTIHWLNDLTAGDCMPDMTFLLDLDPEIGFERVGKRKKEKDGQTDRFETTGMEFHDRVRAGYHEIVRVDNNGRMQVIDATGTREEIHEAIWAKIQPLLDMLANYPGALQQKVDEAAAA